MPARGVASWAGSIAGATNKVSTKYCAVREKVVLRWLERAVPLGPDLEVVPEAATGWTWV